MSSVLERIEKLEQQAALQGQDPYIQMLANKFIGLEKAVASMGKTLAAVSDELTETGVLNGLSVMTRLRQAEDQTARQHVDMLVTQGVITTSDIVSETSLVVIKQDVIDLQTGEAMVISGCNLIGMNSPMSNVAWRDALLGKKVGDTIKGLSDAKEEEIVTIKEIYMIAEREVEGEESADTEEPTQAESSDVFNETSSGE